MIKAVFFDLDGTLVLTHGANRESCRLVLEKNGLDVEKIFQRTKEISFFGMRVVEILEIMRNSVEVGERELSVEKLAKDAEAIFLELVNDRVELLVGAREALEFVKKNNKIVSITSSGTRSYIELIINKFGLGRYLDFFIGGEDVSLGKPNPECYLKSFKLANKFIDLDKHQCLVVEDSVNGITAGKKAGMKVCLTGRNAIEYDGKIDFKVENLSEFLSLKI